MEGKIEKFPINAWLFQGGINFGDMHISKMMCFISPEEKCIKVGYIWATDEYTQEDMGEIEEDKVFENQSEMAYNYLLPTFESISKEVEKNIKQLSPSFKRDEYFLFHYFIQQEFETAFFKEYARILEEKIREDDDEKESPALSPYTIGVTVDEKISDMKFFNIKFIACAFYPEDNCANISYEYVLKNSEDKEKHTKTFNVFYESKNSELSGFYHYFRTALKVGLEKCYYMCDETGSIDGAMYLIEKELEHSFSAIYDLIQTAKTI
jgi:hypothetical protein